MKEMKKSFLFSVLILWIFSFVNSFAAEAEVTFPYTKTSFSSVENNFSKASVALQQPLHSSIVEVGERIFSIADAFSNLKIQSFHSANQLDFQQIKTEKGLRSALRHSKFLLINLSASQIIFPFHYFW